MQEKVGVHNFLECGPKRFDQGVGEVAHESDGVRDQDLPACWKREPADGGVQRGKQAILDEDIRPGEPVEQARLASVGVSHQCSSGYLGAAPRFALGMADGRQGLEIVLELRYAFENPAAIAFEVGL